MLIRSDLGDHLPSLLMLPHWIIYHHARWRPLISLSSSDDFENMIRDGPFIRGAYPRFMRWWGRKMARDPRSHLAWGLSTLIMRTTQFFLNSFNCKICITRKIIIMKEMKEVGLLRQREFSFNLILRQWRLSFRCSKTSFRSAPFCCDVDVANSRSMVMDQNGDEQCQIYLLEYEEELTS